MKSKKRVLAIALLLVSFVRGAEAQSFKTLYAFTNGSDGASPNSALILSGSALFGVASEGGTNGTGTLFAVKTDGTSFTNLHSFAGSDGANPRSTLILSGEKLYGTAHDGGSSGYGTVFSVSTNGMGFMKLHDFTALSGGINGDGANPGGLCLSDDTLFGSANKGGPNGSGTLFSVNTDASGFTIFGYSMPDIPDGEFVLSGDTIFGTTGGFIMFAVDIDGSNYRDFGDADNLYPYSGLTLADNTLYGISGGAGGGGLFSVKTDDTGFTNFYYFSTAGLATNVGGVVPTGPLCISGNTLYGTTVYGGSLGYGTVFAVNMDGTGFTNLYIFTNGVDGSHPDAGLLLAGGTLYGTAVDGGSSGYGTVFALPVSSNFIQTTASATAGTVPLTVNFTSSGVDNLGNAITHWIWTFGDGSTSTYQNPSHLYANAGIFVPSLIATNSLGVAVSGSAPTIIVSPPINLVLNGGFETGDFTDWTLSGDTTNTFVDDGSQSGITPYSGNYEAALGTSVSLGYLSQALATTPGTSYLLSFWFENPYADPAEFIVSWNGNTLLDTTSIDTNSWTNMEFVVSATGTNTVLQFGFQDTNDYLGLDAIRVVTTNSSTAISNPGIASLSLSGANLALNGTNGQSGATYYVLTAPNLALPLSQWTPVMTNILSSSGNFSITVTNSVTPSVAQRFYILEKR